MIDSGQRFGSFGDPVQLGSKFTWGLGSIRDSVDLELFSLGESVQLGTQQI